MILFDWTVSKSVCWPAVRVVASPHMVETVEDWARVRSPGRARRRLKRGYRQNIVVRTVPSKSVLTAGGVMYAHPATIKALETKIAADLERRMWMEENGYTARGYRLAKWGCVIGGKRERA